MSQTLTKPILLDETGRAINNTIASDFNYEYEYKHDALDDMADTLAQDWLLTYEDVHSEMDDHVASIADSLIAIKNAIALPGRSCEKIFISSPPDKTEYVTGDQLDTTGLVVCASMVNELDAMVIDVTSKCVITAPELNYGTYSVPVSWTYDGVTRTTSFDVTVSYPFEIVDWSTGTDEEIKAMLDAHYNPNIDFDVTDYWSVGAERIVNLSAISNKVDSDDTDVIQQSITFVLLNAGGKMLSDGTTECAFVVGAKNYLKKAATSGSNVLSLVDTSTYTDNYDTGWDNVDRATWFNTYFRDAIDSSIRSIFKSFKCVSAKAYNDTVHSSSERIYSVETETDTYFTLPAITEVFGKPTDMYMYTKYVGDSETKLSQFEYYTNSSHISQIKPSDESLDDSYITLLTRTIVLYGVSSAFTFKPSTVAWSVPSSLTSGCMLPIGVI